jgi:hypothetical protein
MTCRLAPLLLALAAACVENTERPQRQPEPRAAQPGAEPAAQPAPAEPRAGSASVSRRASRGDFVAERDVELPQPGAVRARRLVEADGGYLDLFRSPDGKTLWASRGYDDGTSLNWEFQLEAHDVEWSDAVLQFVDGVTEARKNPNKVTWNEELGSSEAGRYSMVADAWLVSASARMAMRPPSSRPVPLVHVGRGSGDPAAVQWMVHYARCAELDGKPCVYFGRAKALAERVGALDDKPAGDAPPMELWIFPE